MAGTIVSSCSSASICPSRAFLHAGPGPSATKKFACLVAKTVCRQLSVSPPAFLPSTAVSLPCACVLNTPSSSGSPSVTQRLSEPARQNGAIPAVWPSLFSVFWVVSRAPGFDDALKKGSILYEWLSLNLIPIHLFLSSSSTISLTDLVRARCPVRF